MALVYFLSSFTMSGMLAKHDHQQLLMLTLKKESIGNVKFSEMVYDHQHPSICFI